MADREVDQQLVERAQRGDKRAFELLVLKYQRKLQRLLSRLVRDPGEVEDVTQEAFIKAYRALPSFRGDSAFYTWLYRIGINTAKNYLVAMGRRAPTSTGFDNEEAENFEDAEQLRDAATPEDELHGKQIAATVNKAMDAFAHGDHAARNRGPELRRDCQRDELSDWHGAVPDLPGPRSYRSRIATAVGD
jgi:RNA polymerase sigma-70 factor, ECF subfamily